MDLQYHDVNRQRGLYHRMERRGMVERMASDEDIERALDEPPQTTRARLRWEFIRRAQGAPAGLHGGLGPPEA